MASSGSVLTPNAPFITARSLAVAAMLAISCSSSSPKAPPGDADAGAGGDAIVVPPLDPAACSDVTSAGPPFSATYAALPSTPIEDKALYLLVLLASDPASAAALSADAALSTSGAARDAELRKAAMTCDGDADCIAAAVLPSAASSDADAKALSAALAKAGRLEWLANEQMRPSGRFHRYASLPDEALVESSYRDAAAALENGYNAYARALPKDKRASALSAVVSAHPEPLAFFQPMELVVLAALAEDGRDEAARYEPLEKGENAAVKAAIPSIDFTAYPFSVILVPGKGPADPTVILDPSGAARCDLAAARFQEGLAPIIAVSGGHVHPDRTLYAEAIEMKKYLITAHSIPEDRILIDPHARHTTTNLRNVSRLTLRYGAPADRPMLVTTDLFQSLYIGYWSGMFGPRCQDELGYLPWRALVPISENDSCFVPTTLSLHQDARDLLDP